VVCNFTPVPRDNYGIGVPHGGAWREVLNSDAGIFGGSGLAYAGSHFTAPLPAHGCYHSLYLTLPPLATMFLISEEDEA
jgi:1,4-alpha-glucan branching enzyme